MKNKTADNEFNPQTMKAMANAMLQLELEITRLREGRKIHNCEAAEAQIVELEKDAAILDWLADNQAIEIIGDWNIHEIAIYVADERDADAEPTVEDYRLALRRLIRAAMDEEHQYIEDLQGEEAAHSGEGEK